VWHVSISIRNDRAGVFDSPTIKPAAARRFQVGTVRFWCLELLKGVGCGPAKFEAGDVAFHLRRRVAPAELAKLPQTWCAIPPIDDGGEMKLIEWIEEA
jgi:hypothetical protein